MTIKLYWDDSHLTAFTARVVDVSQSGGRNILVLDQTAFYPLGGGQPADRGTIGGVSVLDVTIEDDSQILHYLERPIDVLPGAEIAGEIDWAYRREMMQQHTGQHIISQAFFQLYGAETCGFRITERAAEIDLALELDGDEIPRALLRAEELANSVVFDNREVRAQTLMPADAARLPLRKESFITDCVRVVEIADFDFSPCGGTHAKRTGEVGLIAVRGWERAKRMTRVRFVCGARALQDYREANGVTEAVARRFTVGRSEIEASIERLFDENKALNRRVRELAELAARAEASDIIDAVAPADGKRIIARVFVDRDFDELKLLAHRLVERKATIAMLATRQGGTARLIFARSSDLTTDVNLLLREACAQLDGRGGGKPDFAQGGGARVDLLEEVLRTLSAKV
jgi:alanyl-tRNA synthetase